MGVKNVLAVLRRAHPADAALSAAADETAGDAERQRVASHATACARCRARIGEYRQVRLMLGAMPLTEPPRSFRLSPADAHEPSRPPAPVRANRGVALRAMPALAAAAAVVFAALVGVDVLGGSGGGDAADRAVAVVRAGSPAAATSNGQEKSLAPAPSTSGGAPEPAIAGDSAQPTPASGLQYGAQSLTPEAAAPPAPRSAGTSATPPASNSVDGGEVSRGAATPATADQVAPETKGKPSGGGIEAVRWGEAGTAAVALLTGIGAVVMWRRREDRR